MRSAKRIPVAVQLYSIRSVIAGDVPGSLARLAAMGYEGVELAGYYDLDGAEWRRLLDANNLRCAGAHCGMQTLEGDAFENTVAINQALGNRLLIIPSANLDNLDATIERMNAIHARAKDRGMRVGFHNHTKEFEMVDGVTAFDRIFRATPDDFLAQVDIGWATAARQDVVALLRRYARRIESVHVKEYHPEKKSAVVGEGTVDWPAVLTVLENETAVRWYVVEQEQYDIGPMESVAACRANLRAIGR